MEKKHFGIVKFIWVTLLLVLIGIAGDDETRNKLGEKIKHLTARK